MLGRETAFLPFSCCWGGKALSWSLPDGGVPAASPSCAAGAGGCANGCCLLLLLPFLASSLEILLAGTRSSLLPACSFLIPVRVTVLSRCSRVKELCKPCPVFLLQHPRGAERRQDPHAGRILMRVGWV